MSRVKFHRVQPARMNSGAVWQIEHNGAEVGRLRDHSQFVPWVKVDLIDRMDRRGADSTLGRLRKCSRALGARPKRQNLSYHRESASPGCALVFAASHEEFQNGWCAIIE